MKDYPTYTRRKKEKQLPKWVRLTMLFISLSAMSASYAYSVRPDTIETVKVVTKTIIKEVPIYPTKKANLKHIPTSCLQASMPKSCNKFIPS